MIGVSFSKFNIDQNSEVDSGCYEIVRFFDGLDKNANMIKEIPFEYTSAGDLLYKVNNNLAN